jgi:hypothetical protein
MPEVIACDGISFCRRTLPSNDLITGYANLSTPIHGASLARFGALGGATGMGGNLIAAC